MVLDNRPILQATVRDITKSKEAEEEIKHLAFMTPSRACPTGAFCLIGFNIIWLQVHVTNCKARCCSLTWMISRA